MCTEQNQSKFNLDHNKLMSVYGFFRKSGASERKTNMLLVECLTSDSA